MKIDYRPVDDLKTERPDITPPLPATLRLVPILFYVVVLGGIVLSSLFLVVLRNAAADEQRWKAETAERTQRLNEVEAERRSLEGQAHRASDIVAWVEGARSLQPLVVEIIRSMSSSSSITSLALSRDPATATQVKLALKLNTQDPRQLDTTLEAIAARNFRTYNPNQTQSRGEIDYEATLLYQNPRSLPEARPPSSAATPPPPAQAKTP
jgi:hypothetical protein